MGIQGLLPFLANSTRDAHISEFENHYVAIDAYCWLHKGIYSCAFEVAMKKPTLKYVTYCMRYIEMLHHFKVKPILVFDGMHLLSKRETEKKRREERRKKYEKGKELMRAGKQTEGRKLLGESVDISHEIALNLIKKCRERNIDCIIAPHEADAQLAFFSINKIVKCVITEDSDLLAYGSERVMFKMDTSGRGKLIEKSEIHFSLNMTPEDFNEDIFRYMCILSGCDYLPSLPSIGLANSLKFIKMLKGNDIYDALPKLPLYINKMNVKVTPEYILGFKMADATFKHQLVYDPLLRLQVPLHPAKSDDDIVGTKLPKDLAFDLAVGNIDPITMKKVDNFNPDKNGRGFTILWKKSSSPKDKVSQPSPSQSRSSLFEAKKRQRENLDYETVQSITNNLKKQRIPPISLSTRKFYPKNSIQSIPQSGFDFDPKISNDKKSNVTKSTDKSKLLRSRYFLSEKDKRRDKHTPSLNDKRKDETNEDYMERLLNEYFPPGCEEAETNDEGCYCATRDERRPLENFCSLCEKCQVCCTCSNENGSVSDSQKLFECIRKIEELKKRGEEDAHFLLDEINKETENSEKNSQQEEEDKSEDESPGLSLSHNFSKVLARFDSTEKENEKTETVREKSPEVVCMEEEEPVRTPSPVFNVRKEARVLNTNCRLQNGFDTAGTPTSLYFSNSGCGSLDRSNPQVPLSRTPTDRDSRKPLVKSFRSVPAKVGRSQPKTSTVNRTLFQFGFKKERR